MAIDLCNLVAPQTVVVAPRKGNGVFTIVNSKKNGKRIELLEPLHKILNLTDKIKLGFCDNTLVIAPEEVNLSLPVYNLKDVGKKKVIYSSGLVAEITNILNIDFTERVSVTLSRYEIESCSGIDIAIVSV